WRRGHGAPVRHERDDIREHSREDEGYPWYSHVSGGAEREQPVGDEPENDGDAVGRPPRQLREREGDELEGDRDVEHADPGELAAPEPLPATAEKRRDGEADEKRQRERH